MHTLYIGTTRPQSANHLIRTAALGNVAAIETVLLLTAGQFKEGSQRREQIFKTEA